MAAVTSEARGAIIPLQISTPSSSITARKSGSSSRMTSATMFAAIIPYFPLRSAFSSFSSFSASPAYTL